MIVHSAAHVLSYGEAGVQLKVTIETTGGDPALSRGFADEITQIIEDELVRRETRKEGNVLQFPVTHSPQPAA